VNVQAETLYEAVVLAIRAFREHDRLASTEVLHQHFIVLNTINTVFDALTWMASFR
jgi:hypothetical protein